MGTFRDLSVWQKAHTLVLQIYRITKKFPEEERYGLVSQKYHLMLSRDLDYLEQTDFDQLIAMCDEVGRMLAGFQKSLSLTTYNLPLTTVSADA